MITIKTNTKTNEGVRFADMIPGKLYRFSYSGSTGGIVTGVAGINDCSRRTFTILHVKQATARGITCDDKVGNTWVGKGYEIPAKTAVAADGITITINNDE